jgi:hypothetical protein
MLMAAAVVYVMMEPSTVGLEASRRFLGHSRYRKV